MMTTSPRSTGHQSEMTTDHITHTHTHTRLTALCPGLPRWAGTRKVKPIWILLEQETVSGSGISWAICKSAPCSRQMTTPAPHHSVFYRPDALPAAQATASKHWRQIIYRNRNHRIIKIIEIGNHIKSTDHIIAMIMRGHVTTQNYKWLQLIVHWRVTPVLIIKRGHYV